jgi:hypothetical protein
VVDPQRDDLLLHAVLPQTGEVDAVEALVLVEAGEHSPLPCPSPDPCGAAGAERRSRSVGSAYFPKVVDQLRYYSQDKVLFRFVRTP